jgi:hypothetical protein
MSKIPDSLMTRPLPSVDTMNIDTSILEPLVASTTFCRFQMERRGILDSGSAIQIGIVVPGLADLPNARACLPIKTGIHCAVKRAILRIGEKVIAITDDYAKYATIHRAFKTTEEKSQKEMVTKGCIDVLAPDEGLDGTTSQSNGMYSLRDVETLQVGGAAMTLPFEQFLLQPTAEDTPFFHIKLSDLFPMMKNIQLPLYLIDQPCVIELFFNTQNNTMGDFGNLACFDATTLAGLAPLPDGAAASLPAQVAPESLRFLCDYLTYTDERMNRTAQMVMSQDGLTIPYEDVVTTNTNFQAGAGPSTLDITRDLGVSSMSLRAILGHYEPPHTDPAILLQGPYASVGFKKPETIQLRLNDKQVYQRPLQRETQKQHQISQVFGTDLSVLNSEFSFDSVVEKDTFTVTNPMISGSFLGYPQENALQGSQHYMGVDFSSPGNYGVTIGQKPIQVLSGLTYTDAQDWAGRTTTYYSLVERSMRLKGGLVEVSS